MGREFRHVMDFLARSGQQLPQPHIRGTKPGLTTAGPGGTWSVHSMCACGRHNASFTAAFDAVS